MSAKIFVFANGAAPNKLSIPGEDLLIDSTVFMDIEELPKDILFVGGGYIAFEFAHIASRFGSKVTVVHRDESPLRKFDPDLVKLLLKASEAMGIEIILNAEVKSIMLEGGGLKVLAEKNGKELILKTSLAVHAGRSAEVIDMGLEKMNVSFDKKGIVVNEFMQSVSNASVYSCGDANDKGLPLTPVATKEAIVVTDNLLNGNHRKINYGLVPSNVFSIPALSLVGLT